MAKKILTPYDFSRLELLNVRLQNLVTDPATPTAGMVYYNSSTNKFMWFNGTAYIDSTARANHTGTQLAATISNFDTTVRLNRLDQMATPIAAVAMGGQKITGLAEGTNPTDAVSYSQLQSFSNGTDWKDSVRVISVTNVPSLSGLLTIDGVTLVAGDRVALVGQTVGSNNGLYVAASGAWTRSTDADGVNDITPNMAFFVEEGTTYADSQWRLTTDGTITIGTTSLSYGQIGAGTSYTAGIGVILAGNVFSVDPAVVTRKFALTVGTGAATSIAVSHGLNTLDVQVQVVLVSTGETVECDVVRTSTAIVTLGFAVAPATNSIRVLVQG